MTYNFTKDISTKDFSIKIDTGALYGYFEHNEFGDECGGGLWFDDLNNLLDYDGVAELPAQVISALVSAGYKLEEEFL